MKILLITRYFPPEIGTAANLFYELATALSRNGHMVSVATGFPWYNLKEIPRKYAGKIIMHEEMHGFRVKRLAFPLLPGPQKIKLAAGHLSSPVTAAISGMMVSRPDVIYVYSPPLFMGLAAWVLQGLKQVPFILGVQDLHPQCYIDQGVLKNRFIISVLEAVERFSYRRASLITVHSEGNKDHIVQKKGISEKKVKVIPNWIDTEEMRPLPRDNEFSRKYNLNGKFTVSYAGTLSISQGLMSIIEAANILRDRKGIEFFIVGDGIEKQKMMNKAKEYNLDNVRFLGMQPKSIYPYVVASSDVGLVTLNSMVKTPVVPSKILSMMAAARPVLASMPLEGDAPKLIEDAKCGICIGPENHERLAEEIVRLSEDPDLCKQFSKQGCEYVVREMSLQQIVRELEKLFDTVIHSENTRRR